MASRMEDGADWILLAPLLTELLELLIDEFSPEFNSTEYSPSDPCECTDDEREETVELHLLPTLWSELC